MLPTFRQLAVVGRGKKKRRCEVAALMGAPQKKGIIIKMGVTTPKKPNSAKRKKKRRCEVAALMGAPQKKGIIIKMGVTTPKKPNSAKRKFARLRIIQSKKLAFAHPPGIGPTYIQEYSIVLVEGGSPPDVPGINYSLIRGVYDFRMREEYGRRRRRSKFGTEKPNILFSAPKSVNDNFDLPAGLELVKDHTGRHRLSVKF